MTKKLILLGGLLLCSTELYASHSTETTEIKMFVIEPPEEQTYEVNFSSQSALSNSKAEEIKSKVQEDVETTGEKSETSKK